MLLIITRLLVYTIHLKTSVRAALGLLLHERFNDSEHPQRRGTRHVLGLQEHLTEADGVQSLERMTWLRWLWFLLGTLPPAIKLASMTGINWTKAWGMMLLASWVVNELLIIFATFNQSFITVSKTRHISWPGYEQTTRSLKFQQVNSSLDHLETWMTSLALGLHAAMLNMVFRILCVYLEVTESPRFDLQTTRYQINSTNTFIVSIGTLVEVALVGSLFPNRNIGTGWNFAIALFCLMLSSTGTNAIMYGHASLSSVYVCGFFTTTIPAFLWLTGFLGQRFVLLGRNLLVLHRIHHEEPFYIDYGACLSLAFFFSTLVATLFWYGHMYNSSGTTVPVWTGVFG